MNVELYRWPGYVVMYRPLSVFWEPIEVSRSIIYECQEFLQTTAVDIIAKHEVSIL